ncbi:MAG: hypothetical protein IH788_00865, partial [Nitrospinae bacterium]|nr:hypothetical protein [Nitrospinota bacterium]
MPRRHPHALIRDRLREFVRVVQNPTLTQERRDDLVQLLVEAIEVAAHVQQAGLLDVPID